MRDQSTNSFVSYLNRYCTTSAKHESAFDEYIAGAPPPPAGPLRLDTTVERFLIQRFREDRPPSIILTGNAGDGKTYLSRRIITEFTGTEFTNWGSSLDQLIPRNGVALHVVKDLSEVDEEKGRAYLGKLAATFEQPDPDDVFLIAANEGRLRRLLLKQEYHALRNEVDDQLEHSPRADGKLVVINLNQIATSLLLPQVMVWLTDERNWPTLSEASVAEDPIHYNVKKLRDPYVQQQIQLLYCLLERLGHHITIRDMLIHLAFVVTAGKTTKDLLELPLEERRKYVYYNNIVGTTANEVFRSRSAVLRLLAPLQFGGFSCYDLDDFIVNGHETGHPYHQHYNGLFEEKIDLGQKLFVQDRDAYLHSSTSSTEAGERFLAILPALRRKAFFEWAGDDARALTHQLLFLERFDEYEALLHESIRHEQVKRQLILGLNRVFSGLYLETDDALLLTSQYTNKVSVTVPIVMATLPADNLDLHAKSTASNVIDRHPKVLELIVYPPPRLQKLVDPIPWRIDLLTYEYLIRRALGGTPDVLADECELEIRMLKDRLTRDIVNNLPAAQLLRFIGPESDGYRLFEAQLQGEHIVVSPS